MALLKKRPGDIIGIPAKKEDVWGFVLCRIIRIHPTTWTEVFSNFYENFNMSEEEVLQKDFSPKNRLFPPIYASFDFGRHFGRVKWPILASDIKYDPEISEVSEIEFQNTSYYELGSYSKGEKECHEPAGLLRNLEDRTIYSNPQLIHRINLYLSGYFTKGEPWNPSVVRSAIEKEGKDWWANGIKLCKDTVDSIAVKFRKTK